MGFEVFYRHRVGSVKAARLNVPWLELQAEATACDPYVLPPVADDLIRGDDEPHLGWSLTVPRADLPVALRARLEQRALLEDHVDGRSVPRPRI